MSKPSDTSKAIGVGIDIPIPTGKGYPSVLSLRWNQLIARVLRALANPRVDVVEGGGCKYILTDGNATLCIDKTLFGSSVSGSALTPYKITNLYSANYVQARQWNLSTGDYYTGSVNVYIAKCLTARMPANETIDGITITYTGYTDNIRKATIDTAFEWQVMHPRYSVGTIIYALGVTGGTGIIDPSSNVIQSVEVEAARVWARQLSQSGTLP
jgi:hypothetical protein